MLGEYVGKELQGCSWVGIPFCGSLAEVPHIKAPTIVCSDLHRHVINLAKVASHPVMGLKLFRNLRRVPFHEDVLRTAQEYCIEREPDGGCAGDQESAYWYFITSWMGRSAQAGTYREFCGKLPVRWSASGGDSAVRFSSAVKSLGQWRKILERCNFVVMDVFKFLDSVKDQDDIGVYCDPPFPGPGDAYKHKFSEADQEALAARLVKFTNTRVVCRFYDTPLIRRLYPEASWAWKFLEGRKQSNEAAPEVLLVRNQQQTVKFSVCVHDRDQP